MTAANEYADITSSGRKHRSHRAEESQGTAVRDSLVSALNDPQTAPQNIIPAAQTPLFHFPGQARKKGTLL
jgi:hypothetical protein